MTPICQRKVKPLAHMFVASNLDPRYKFCINKGCHTVIGPAAKWGEPIEPMKATQLLLFGDDTPPVVARPARKLRAQRDSEALRRWLGTCEDEGEAQT